jgi:alpha-ketoglutaric semialdehyde dehydrogenase
MVDSFGNYIAGNWIDAGDFIDNVIPSDTNDIIGRYHQANPAQLNDGLAAASNTSRIWAASRLEKR